MRRAILPLPPLPSVHRARRRWRSRARSDRRSSSGNSAALPADLMTQLRLIGRVCGVPSGAFEDVPLDDGRQMGSVVTLSDERSHNRVARCNGPHSVEQLRLGECRSEVKGIVLPNVTRNGFRDQSVENSQRRGPEASLPRRCRADRYADRKIFRRACRQLET